MAYLRSLGTLAAFAVVGVALLPGAALAQFGGSLPRNDFTWTWGDSGDAARRFAPDFSLSGGEGGFRCDLSGRLRLGSQWSRMDIRQLENDLRVSTFFVRSAARTMNVLDQRRELDWATLDCRKPAESEPDAEAEQEQLDRERQKVIEEMRRRRERQRD